MTTVLAGQTDIFGNTAEKTTTKARRPNRVLAEPKPGAPARWTRIRVAYDCDDCWHTQHHAAQTGEPVRHRHRATVRMRAHRTDLRLCSTHARERGWNPVKPRGGHRA